MYFYRVVMHNCKIFLLLLIACLIIKIKNFTKRLNQR